jgi:hypothetical protein
LDDGVQGIELDPPELDLGTLEPKKSIEREFRITNRSDRSFFLAEIKTSCKCLTLAYRSKAKLDPGKSVPVKVTFRSESRGFRDLKLTISVTDTAIEPVVMHVRYNVIPEPTVRPNPLLLGRHPAGSNLDQEMTVELKVPADKEVPKLEVFLNQEAPVEVVVGKPKISPSSEAINLVQIPVTLKIDSSESFRLRKIGIVFQGQIRPVIVPFSVHVYSDWFVERDRIHYAVMKAGTSKTKDIALYYTGEEPPKILEVKASADFVSVRYEHEPDRHCIRFHVTLKDVPKGQLAENVAFRTSLTEDWLKFKLRGTVR